MTLRNIAIWVFIALVVVGAYAVVSQQTNTSSTHQIIYSQLLQKMDQHQVRLITIKGDEVTAKDKSGGTSSAVVPADSEGQLATEAQKSGADVEFQKLQPNL